MRSGFAKLGNLCHDSNVTPCNDSRH
jgi:hypothetical protein